VLNSFLVMDDKDMNFIINAIQEKQIIFHPSIAPEGKIDYAKFSSSKCKKPFALFLDRNILSSLLKFCEQGFLKNANEAQLIGLIMTWAEMNNIPISAGMAIQERASQLHSQEEALVELQKFLEAFAAYPGQIWLKIAEGQLTKVTPVTFSLKPAQGITVDYTDCGEHYDMEVASLLRAVRLYRDKTMRPIEKIQNFFKWMCDHLLISEYLLVYVTMLFTQQGGIKAPKHANSNDVEEIVNGCKNQAWDIAYLTYWSTFYSNTDAYNEEFLFATNDVLLKRIFINTNGPNRYNGLLAAILSAKEYNQLMDYFEPLIKERIKPDFGYNPREYFQRLIEKEKRLLIDLLTNN